MSKSTKSNVFNIAFSNTLARDTEVSVEAESRFDELQLYFEALQYILDNTEDLEYLKNFRSDLTSAAVALGMKMAININELQATEPVSKRYQQEIGV